MTNAYSAAAGSTTGLVLFWLVLVVTAPIAEEVISRLSVPRRSATWLGGVGALMLTSLIFGRSTCSTACPA